MTGRGTGGSHTATAANTLLTGTCTRTCVAANTDVAAPAQDLDLEPERALVHAHTHTRARVDTSTNTLVIISLALVSRPVLTGGWGKTSPGVTPF